jgi:hypothetical protein
VFGVEAGEQDAGRVAVLDVGGRHEQIDEKAVLVNQEMPLPPVDVFVRVVSSRCVRHGLRAFDGLGVHDHPDRPGAAPAAQPQPPA